MKFKILENTEKEFSGSLEDIITNFDLNDKIIKNKIEKLLNNEINNNSKTLKIVFAGTKKEFKGNLKEIANHFNINYNTLKARVRYGYSLEDAIDWNKKITVFKNTEREFTGTRKEIAKHFNIHYNTLNSRLYLNHNNLSLEEAIDYSAKKCTKNNYSRNIIYTVFKGTDREFSGKLSDIQKHFNIDKTKFYNGLRYRTLEEVIDDIKKYPEYTVFKGTELEFTGNINQISKHFNINYDKLKGRIRNNKRTIEEAIKMESCDEK